MASARRAENNPVSGGAAASRRVVMLIYPGVIALDVAGPLDVFGWANFVAKQALYDIVTVAPTSAPVPTRTGFAILPMAAMADVPRPIDTLLVAGGGGPDRAAHPEMIAWVRDAAHGARRVGSICTGAFVLGAAGLLDGRRAVTHWGLCADLATRHQSVRVELDPIFIRDGNVYTSAGVTTGIDLALALVEEDHGRALALAVARYLVLFLRRSGGQAQFSTQLRAEFSGATSMRELQLWCRENIAQDLSVSALAGRMRMSERNFARRFVEETGRKPWEFVLAERMAEACRLLEQTDLPLKEVTRRCGLGSVPALRRVFAHRIGVTPSDYRERFRAGAGVGVGVGAGEGAAARSA